MSLFLLFVLPPIESTQCWQYVYGLRTIYWSTGSLSGATSLKKTNTPYLRSSVSSSSTAGVRLCPHLLPSCWDFCLVWSCAGFVLLQLSWVYMPCWVLTTVLLQPFIASGAIIFLLPFLWWCPCLRRRYGVDVAFRAENSAVSYSLHVGRLSVSVWIPLLIKEDCL